MRQSGKWMTIWDDRILEYIQENGASSVGKLTDSEYIRVSNAHVSRRCKKLVEHRMLVHLGNGVYNITQQGESYLAGETDAEDESESGGASESSTA
jgi:hypothetical protein